MVGFSDTSVYDNATLDNWLMTAGWGLGHRMLGALIQIDSSYNITVSNLLGGISPYVERSSTGLYTVTFELQFSEQPAIFAACLQQADQAFVYSPSKSGCNIVLRRYSGGSWALDDFPFAIYAIGI